MSIFWLPASILFSGLSLRREDDLGHEDKRTDDNGAVGDIEIGPYIVAQIKLEEINHVTGEEPVPKIAEGTAHDERERESRTGHFMGVLPKERGDDEQSDDRKANQKADLVLRGRFGEQAKSRSPVQDVSDSEKSRYDGNAVVQRYIGRDHGFGDAVEEQHRGSDQNVIFTHDLGSLHLLKRRRAALTDCRELLILANVN